MMGFGIFLLIIAVAGIIGIGVLRKGFQTKLARIEANGKRAIRSGDMDEQDVQELKDAEQFWVPGWAGKALAGVAILGFMMFFFGGSFFYAEPTYKYHVRTILGQERVVSNKTGYAWKFFGRVNRWKNAMTVQATSGRVGSHADDDDVSTAESDVAVSANLPPQTVVFLDQVDAKGTATARFRLPTDDDTFLHLVHEYRTPANFLNTELIPAFKETIQASGSLMSAEEYFSGGRTDFNAEFANQMENGIYMVRRTQVLAKDVGIRKKTADASATKQQDYDPEDEGKVVFKVEKRLNPDTGQPLRKPHNYANFGVQMVAARVTDMIPNEKFRLRMDAKQEASAQRAVNREKRIEEEEKKFFAIAKGEREVAEEQAKAKKVQIKATTEAETTKRLALIKANQQKEQARIEKETASIQKERADIDAERIKVLADAAAYEKRAVIEADDALAQKLEAWVKAQEVWAEAFANRKVPTTIFGSSGAGGTGAGTDNDVQAFMNIMTMQAAKSLNVDPTIRDVTTK